MERFCIHCGSSNVEETLEEERFVYKCCNCGRKDGRVRERDPDAVEKQSENGRPMHVSIGAVIVRDNKYLLLDRRRYPFCYAIIAGHLHKGEAPEAGIIREVKEEGSLEVKSLKLIYHGIIDGDKCRRGADIHEWYLFECNCIGQPEENDEAKRIEWLTEEDLRKINLCFATEYLFLQAGIL